MIIRDMLHSRSFCFAYPPSVLLALWLSACFPEEGGVRIEFTGRDVNEAEGYLSVTVERDRQRILVSSMKYRFELPLPWREHWRLISSRWEGEAVPKYITALEAFGWPGSDLTVLVSICRPEHAVEPESYLHETLKKGTRWTSAVFEKVGANPVMCYVEDKYIGAISVRQRAGGAIYEIHLYSLEKEEPKLSEMRKLMKEIAGEKFRLAP